MYIIHSISNYIGPIVKYIFNPWQDNLYVQRNNQFHGIHCNVRQMPTSDGSKPEGLNSWKHVA